MNIGWLERLLIGSIPVCAAVAAGLTKYLSRYSWQKAVSHPAFFGIPALGAFEFFSAMYLYRNVAVDGNGTKMPLAILESVTVIGAVLAAVLIGVGVFKETLDPVRATAMVLIVPLLLVVITGWVPWPF